MNIAKWKMLHNGITKKKQDGIIIHRSFSVIAFVVVVVLVLRLRKRRRFWDDSTEFLCFSFGISLLFSSLFLSSQFLFFHHWSRCFLFLFLFFPLLSSCLDQMSTPSVVVCPLIQRKENSLSVNQKKKKKQVRLICFTFRSMTEKKKKRTLNGQFDPISTDRRQKHRHSLTQISKKIRPTRENREYESRLNVMIKGQFRSSIDCE